MVTTAMAMSLCQGAVRDATGGGGWTMQDVIVATELRMMMMTTMGGMG